MKLNKTILTLLLILRFSSYGQDAKKDLILTKDFPQTNLKVKISYSGTFEGEFEVIKVTTDTIYLFASSIEELKSIKPLNAEDKFEVFQRYKSLLHIGFDGKNFVAMDNWKVHYSPYINIWFDNKGNNIKPYSHFDYAYFPDYTNEELINGIKLNAKKFLFSEHWIDSYIIRIKNNEEEELNLCPAIVETQFKVIDRSGKQLIIIVKHQIVC